MARSNYDTDRPNGTFDAIVPPDGVMRAMSGWDAYRRFIGTCRHAHTVMVRTPVMVAPCCIRCGTCEVEILFPKEE